MNKALQAEWAGWKLPASEFSYRAVTLQWLKDDHYVAVKERVQGCKETLAEQAAQVRDLWGMTCYGLGWDSTKGVGFEMNDASTASTCQTLVEEYGCLLSIMHSLETGDEAVQLECLRYVAKGGFCMSRNSKKRGAAHKGVTECLSVPPVQMQLSSHAVSC